jgi:predicted transcriptional regulator
VNDPLHSQGPHVPSSATTEPAAGAATEKPDPERSARRRAFLLQQVAEAPGQTLRRGQANRTIPRAVVRDLGLTSAEANRVREALAREQHLRIAHTGKSATFELTDQGRALLQTLVPYAPPPSRGVLNPPADVNMARWRKSYLLLQLLQAEGQTRSQAEANRLDTLGRRRLQLNAATARHLRHQLAAEGLLRVARDGRQESYALTDAGRLHLGTLDFYDSDTHPYTFRLQGRLLNQLLEAARETAKQFETPAGTASVGPATPPAADLAVAVLEVFADLRREKYQMSGMVPVHEVRQRIRAKYGEEAARHAVLDDVILGLWRGGRLRLASISDQGRATAEQLQDSIPGVGETLFYLEAAHEPAVR